MSHSRWEHQFEWMSAFYFYGTVREMIELSQDSVDKGEEGIY